MKSNLPYVDAMQILPAGPGAKEVEIIIRGSLPNPAYTYRGVQIESVGEQINIVPQVEYNEKAMVVQMLVPFADTIRVPIARPGAYKIMLRGRDKSIIKAMRISK